MDKVDTTSVENFLAPYLPESTSLRTPKSAAAPASTQASAAAPIVTLTWAQSLDGRIAAAPGERTRLSGLYTKKMTHYLRSKHDAILVGCSTVLADNPRLNCRYSANSPSPVPVILDPLLKWDFSANWENWAVLAQAYRGENSGPWVVVNLQTEVPPNYARILEQCGGKIIRVEDTHNWPEVYAKLHELGVRSLMVEGGAQVIDSCIRNGHIDSVIVTIAPVFLGRNGVDAAPSIPIELQNVQWWAKSNNANNVESDDGIDGVDGVVDSVMAATYSLAVGKRMVSLPFTPQQIGKREDPTPCGEGHGEGSSQHQHVPQSHATFPGPRHIMEPSIIRDSNADDIDDWIDGDLDFETAWERYMGDVQKEAQHSTSDPSPQPDPAAVSSSASDKQQQFKPISPKPASTNEGLLNFEESNAFSQFLDSLIQKPSSPQQDSYGKIDQELQKLHELLGLSPPQHQTQAESRQLQTVSQGAGEPHQQQLQQQSQQEMLQHEQHQHQHQHQQHQHQRNLQQQQQHQQQHQQQQQLQQLQQHEVQQQESQRQHQHQQNSHQQDPQQQHLHQKGSRLQGQQQHLSQQGSHQQDSHQQGSHQARPQEPKLQNHSLYKQPQVFSHYQEPYTRAYPQTLPSHMLPNQSQVLQSSQQLPMYPYDYGSYTPSSMTSQSAPPKSVSPLGVPLLPLPPLSAPPMSVPLQAQSSAPRPAPLPTVSEPMSASQTYAPQPVPRSTQLQSRSLQTAPEGQVEVPWRGRQSNKVNVRIKHVNSEKKRRALISDLYSQMCELLPVEIRELLPKSVVLKNTYRHMKTLEANNASLREKLVQNGVNCDNVASVLLDKVPHSLLEHWDLEDDRK